ncbi:hypothetical protein CDAR_416241 [Caerostris darwini]|uniref:Uncharacterized protein n=1 Tax=Caerostris darwini TaxID=1538125 RepID=A0AAV4W8N8_9ARAC|nr:hypothetical protein CDAR_416241 [Caerostris darwini]
MGPTTDVLPYDNCRPTVCLSRSLAAVGMPLRFLVCPTPPSECRRLQAQCRCGRHLAGKAGKQHMCVCFSGSIGEAVGVGSNFLLRVASFAMCGKDKKRKMQTIFIGGFSAVVHLIKKL